VPIVPAAEGLQGSRIDLPVQDDQTTPGALDVSAAALRQMNSVSSLIASHVDDGDDDSPVDVWAEIEGTPYADHADRFVDVMTRSQLSRMKQRIDIETEDRRTLQDAGTFGLVASLGAGVTDPLFLLTMALPGGQEIGAGRALAFGRAAVRGAAAEIPLEASLYATQVTRTPTESALNIGGAALLSGIVGSAIAKRLPAEESATIARRLQEEFHGSTVGAASVRPETTLAQETIAPGGETLSQTLGRTSPHLRLLNSESKAAREIVQELAETPVLMQKNLEGIATPSAVETTLKRYMGAWWTAYGERSKLFNAWRSRMKAETGHTPTRMQFNEEVAAAMRRGDESLDLEIAQAARLTRSIVFDPLKARAIKLGLLSPDVQAQGAMSYLMRQYNVRKIREQQKEWIELLVKGFQNQGLERAEALDIAYQVTRNITGSEHGTLDLRALDNIVPKSGRLKDRTLNLPDELLEPFLVNDIDTLSQAYLRTMAPEVHITERFGDREMKDALQRVKDEYSILKTQAMSAGDTARMKKLEALETRDLIDLAAIRDRLYGHYGAPKDPSHFFVRAGRFIRSLNYTRLLGGQVISALTDVARLAMIYGAPKMIASSLKLATNLKALRIARDEARRMAVGLDLVLNSRGVALGDLAEFSTFAEQRAMRRISDAFSIASLQSPWNALMKSWASVMSQDDILEAALTVANGGKISSGVRARMASLGLDNNALRTIANQYSTHGLKERGLRFGMSDQWTDSQARELFENAVLREADTAILTPGAGDLPRVHSTEWGKALLQFKSFALASTTRLLIPIAQGFARGDINTMIGTQILFGMGALVYVLKQWTAGQPIETDPTRFAQEMVDKSGVLAWGGDLLFPMLWQFGNDDLSRWSDRQPVETIGGPVAGTIADAYTTRWPKRLMDGDVSQADVHKLRRLLPGQNLFYARRAINALEADLAD
jgi:hypothetical protein